MQLVQLNLVVDDQYAQVVANQMVMVARTAGRIGVPINENGVKVTEYTAKMDLGQKVFSQDNPGSHCRCGHCHCPTRP